MAFEDVYASKAELYDALVSAEDAEGNLLPALSAICSVEGKEVVELGAGTGRLTRLLAPQVKFLRAFDQSSHMLRFAAQRMEALGLSHKVAFAVAENHALPLADRSCDVSIEGWSIGHVTVWHPETWRNHADAAVDQMLRVLRPGGTAVLIETLGTGVATPRVNRASLAGFYSYLENERGFSSTWIRTDYKFSSAEEADRLVRGFFGDELANRVSTEFGVTLPECTGIWWRVV